MKRSRVRDFILKQKVVTKDSEGVPMISYNNQLTIRGEIWPASDQLQAETYGDRIRNIQNMRISVPYAVQTIDGVTCYLINDTWALKEGAGVCVYSDSEPDYKVISIKAYKMLRLEVEKI